MFPHFFGVPAKPEPVPEKLPTGQTVPYACISGRSLGYAYCGRMFNVGHDYMFPLSAAPVIASTYDPRVKGAVARGGLAACIECCDAVHKEIEREKLA